MTKLLYSAREAAAALGVSYSLLAHQRCKGDGPAFIMFGGRVCYRPRDLEAYLEAQTRTIARPRQKPDTLSHNQDVTAAKSKPANGKRARKAGVS